MPSTTGYWRKDNREIEVTGRHARRHGKLLHDLKECRAYSHLKEEALYRTIRRARFGRGFGTVVRQTAEWMDEWMNEFNKPTMYIIKCISWTIKYLILLMHGATMKTVYVYLIVKCSVRSVHPILKHATFICPLKAFHGTRKIQGSMLFIYANVYVISSDSVYFHMASDD